MTDSPRWRGAFPIPMTPYDGNDRIDETVLADEIEFCVQSGVGGIATPLMVSEFRNLSESERKLMIRLPVEVTAGRVPIIANCAANGFKNPPSMKFQRLEKRPKRNYCYTLAPSLA